MDNKVIKSYKGFNEDMTCRDFQFEEGKEYEQEGEIKACNSGFHACEYPLDCFGYYPPSESVYHEVEQSGDIDTYTNDTKVASSKIKIGARLDFAGIVKASIEYVKTKATKKCKGSCLRSDKSVASNSGYSSVASNSGNKSVASNSGYSSVASNSGYRSVASNSGDRSVASNSGDYSVASNSGNKSVASNSGDYSVASNSGDYSVASNSGNKSVASNSGNKSVASNSGDYSVASNSGKDSVSVGWGKDNKCKGIKGSYLVLSEWGEWDGEKYPLINATMVKVDGKTIKEDTFYALKGGKIVEAE